MTWQPPATMPIAAELWWIVYLRGALVGRGEPYAQGVAFTLKVPNPRPARFVTVEKDGGSVRGVFDRPRIRLNVWSNTDQNADDLARLLVGLALAAPGVDGCIHVEHMSGPNAVADPSGTPRRLSLIEAHHRATVLT